MAEPPQGKTQALNEQVDGVIDKMKENVERIVERGEKVGDLLDASEKMEKEVSLTAGVYYYDLCKSGLCCRVFVFIHCVVMVGCEVVQI